MVRLQSNHFKHLENFILKLHIEHCFRKYTFYRNPSKVDRYFENETKIILIRFS